MDVGLRLLLMIAVTAASLYVGIFLHECGHLLAAWLIGWRPLKFNVGTGRATTILRHGDLHVRLGWWPGGGLVMATAETASWFRLKWFVFAISGPVVTFAIVWGLWRVINLPEYFSDLPLWASGALPFVLTTQALMFLGTVWPRTVQLYGRQYVSDGRQIWNNLAASPQKISQEVIGHQNVRISAYLERGEEERALKTLEQLSRQAGWKPLATRMLWIHWLLFHGKGAEADAAMEKLPGEADTLGISRSGALDGLACIPLYYGHSNLRERALGYIDEAIREDPSAITLKGTKGSLLVEEGRYQEGLELLREVMSHTTEENDRAICSYYIALAMRETGRWQEGRTLLDQALKQYPEHVVRHRVHQLFWNGKA